jgi:hypothetical protein
MHPMSAETSTGNLVTGDNMGKHLSRIYPVNRVKMGSADRYPNWDVLFSQPLFLLTFHR